ncbi:MAG: HslU--HslV peptidase proteolytic subunit [Acidobacteria bacterium]|nr:MAG: HslU--HslV peptidase proteolytic subunit [Acidobacteriota bacterium]
MRACGWRLPRRPPPAAPGPSAPGAPVGRPAPPGYNARCFTRRPRRARPRRARLQPAHARRNRGASLKVHSTTVLSVRHKGKVAMGADGQVTLGQTVMKHGARKIRRLYHDSVLAGFAGSAADGFALFTRFEDRLEEFHGNLERAAVELARDWRSDRVLRRLEALLLVASDKRSFLVSGTGDLIEPDDGLIAIGSGGPCALAAARALVRKSDLGARDITLEALRIASEIDIYTNQNIAIEEI